MSNDTVRKQFDAVARQYDEQRRSLIPCFDDFYGTAVSWVNMKIKRPAILDLGAGTGLFSSFVLDKYPQAAMTLVDFSEDMLKEARHRLANFPTVSYTSADYTTHPFDMKYDAVISSLSIHHLEHEQKQALFRTINRLLTDGGVFVNADQAASRSPWINRRYDELWEQSVRSTGLASEPIEASIERKKQDRNAAMEDQLQWLRDAGFAAAECVFKHHEFAVFVAQA